MTYYVLLNASQTACFLLVLDRYLDLLRLTAKTHNSLSQTNFERAVRREIS